MYKLSLHFENKLPPHTINASTLELSSFFLTPLSSTSPAYSFPSRSLQTLPPSWRLLQRRKTGKTGNIYKELG